MCVSCMCETSVTLWAKAGGPQADEVTAMAFWALRMSRGAECVSCVVGACGRADGTAARGQAVLVKEADDCCRHAPRAVPDPSCF